MSQERYASGDLDDGSPEVNLNNSEKDPILVLTEDLQRLQADFQNYRRRVDKERIEAEDLATSKLLKHLLPALDDIDRASEHQELTGGFKAVANQLSKVTVSLGLSKFADVNVAFDPNIHEALLHEKSGNVDETKVTKVLRPGYRFKGTILRPAQVVVSDPTD